MISEVRFSARCKFLLRNGWMTLRRPRLRRDARNVADEYSAGWEAYRAHLAAAQSLDAWMRIPGLEDGDAFYTVDNVLSYGDFNSLDYYRQVLLESLSGHFPSAKSVTEFGAGLGRNLLYLKRARPEIDVFGYELCRPGVEIANAAAAKFQVKAEYRQLDYLRDPPSRYEHPITDVGFTMFSLEQLPRGGEGALKNILDHVRMGSIHIEPVPENYPMTLRGLLGRIDHWKVDYLRNFDSASRGVAGTVTVERLRSSHNPLMFPSLYVIKKG